MNERSYTLTTDEPIGQIVHGDGRGKYWLGAGGISYCRMGESAYPVETRRRVRLQVEVQIGKACRWVYDGEVETISV